MYSKHLFLVAAALFAIASHATPARAGMMFDFETINGGQAESQFKVEVIDAGTNPFSGLDIVGFKFTNTGPIQSSITDIYFQDGLWYQSLEGIEQSEGVSFSAGAKPEDLPGGNSVSPIFETTVAYTADSDPPRQPNGVNNSALANDPDQEYITIYWNLQSGQSFEELLAAIEADEVRIGIHVQGFADGSSASYIAPTGPSTPPPPVVPEPLSVAIWGAFGGLGLLVARRRSYSS